MPDLVVDGGLAPLVIGTVLIAQSKKLSYLTRTTLGNNYVLVRCGLVSDSNVLPNGLRVGAHHKAELDRIEG